MPADSIERAKQDAIVYRKFDVTPLRFDANGKEMMYVYVDTKHALAGWILFRHPDGQWVTLRKATEDDVERITRVVVLSFHA